MATRTSTSIGPTKKVLAYQNTGTSPVVVTLTLVSETATANPQVSVKIDTSSTREFDYQIDDSSVSQMITNGMWLGFDKSSITPTFGSPSSQNIGGINVGKANGSYYTNGYNGGYQFDPYFILHPEEAGMGDSFKYSSSLKNSGNDIYHYSDTSAMTNSEWEGRNTGSMGSGHDTTQGLSYWQAIGSVLHCPYYHFTVSFNTNSYSEMQYFYTTSSNRSSTRSSNGWIYSLISSGNNPDSFRPDASSYGASGYNGWWWSGSHGIYLLNGTRHSNQRMWLWDTTTVLGSPRNSAVTNQNIEDLISSSYPPVRFAFQQNSMNCNYLAHNPWENKTYIRGCDSSVGSAYDGLVEYVKGSRPAGNVSGRSTAGDGNTFKSSAWGDAIIVISENSGSNGLPQGTHTTRPMCVGYKLWVCYASGVYYYSSDLKDWKTLSEFDTNAPSTYTLLNKIGTTAATSLVQSYYGKAGTVTKKNVDGWSTVPSSGTLENRTSVGNYERTALVVPVGESLYVNNHDASSSVACNVVAIAL